MQIEYRAPVELDIWHYPQRRHGFKQLKKLRESIKKVGFITPVVIDKDNRVIAGHGRVIAAMQLKLKEIPVVVFEGSEDEARAFAIADNRIADEREYDLARIERLVDEIERLSLDEFEIVGVKQKMMGEDAEITEMLPSGYATFTIELDEERKEEIVQYLMERECVLQRIR